MRQPKGGLPGVDPARKAAIAARVPIYGTKVAGRQLYKKFRKVAISEGLCEADILNPFITTQ